jgi:hypothetical protein
MANLGGTSPITIDGIKFLKTTWAKEIEFYEEMFAEDACEELVELRQFVSAFYGSHDDNILEIEN